MQLNVDHTVILAHNNDAPVLSTVTIRGRTFEAIRSYWGSTLIREPAHGGFHVLPIAVATSGPFRRYSAAQADYLAWVATLPRGEASPELAALMQSIGL